MHGDDDNDVDAHDVMKCISGGVGDVFAGGVHCNRVMYNVQHVR